MKANISTEQEREYTIQVYRQSWADIAKAFSIILLVSWHAEGFHWIFSYLRMPLFFLVSGFFAYSAMFKQPARAFFVNKVGNMLYLYVVWSLIVTVFLYIYADRGRVAYHFENLAHIFWIPLPTLWFIYALACAFVLARLLRQLPFVPVLVASLLAYALVDIDISGNVGFIDKFAKLFPFFWIGFKAREAVSALVTIVSSWFPLLFLVYFPLGYLGLSVPDTVFGYYFFVTGLIGIFAVLGLAKALESYRFSNFLAAIGGATVYIYLMHRPALYYFEGVLKKLNIDFVGIGILKVTIIVLACFYVGKWMKKTRGLHHLLSAPWVPEKTRVMK